MKYYVVCPVCSKVFSRSETKGETASEVQCPRCKAEISIEQTENQILYHIGKAGKTQTEEAAKS